MVLVEVLIHASALMVSVAYFSGLAPADTVAQALVYISSTYLAVSYTASFVNSFYPLTLSHGAANNDTVFSPVEPAFVAEAVPSVRAPEPSAAVDDSAKERYEIEAAFIRDGWTTHVSKDGEYIHWGKAGNPTPPSLRRNLEADDDANIFQSARTYSQEHHRQSPYLRPSLKATLIVVGGVVFAVVSVLGVVVWYSQSTFAAAGSSRIAQQALRRRPLRQPIMIRPHVNNSSDAPTSLEEYGVGLDNILEPDAAPNDQSTSASANANTIPSTHTASSPPSTPTSGIGQGKEDFSALETTPWPDVDQASSNHSTTAPTATPGPITLDIRRTLAMGAGGLVQVARCGGEYVAIKRIDKILCHDDHVRESTLNERRILARLAEERAQDETKHPLIIKLLAAFQSNESLYLMLDYHPTDLHTRIDYYHYRKKAFPRRLLRFHIYELCTAVVGLHEAGIIHRDIKPENILIDRQGHIVVCDFGLAADSPGVEPSKLVSPSWMRWRDTVALTFAEDKMVGTEYYTAPEILLGWAYGTAVDWWSVGAVMYHMWTSMRPFEDQVLAHYDHADMPESARTYIKTLTTCAGESPTLPDDLEGDDRDFLAGLMLQNPQLRLDDFAIRHHAFFRQTGYKWDDIAARKITPPPDPYGFRPPFTDDNTTLEAYNERIEDARERYSQPDDAHFASYDFAHPKGLGL